MTMSADESDDIDRAHLKDIEDGCGCAEIWEATSHHRKTTDD